MAVRATLNNISAYEADSFGMSISAHIHIQPVQVGEPMAK